MPLFNRKKPELTKKDEELLLPSGHSFIEISISSSLPRIITFVLQSSFKAFLNASSFPIIN